MEAPRFFYNLPAMPDISTVERAADELHARRVAGYAAIDGLRANIEIDATVAELLDRAAMQVELRGCALEAIAESFISHT